MEGGICAKVNYNLWPQKSDPRNLTTKAKEHYYLEIRGLSDQ
jgi:hypothetical protein